MKVARLIELLADMDPDADVFVCDRTLGDRTWDVMLDDVNYNGIGQVFLEATGAPSDEGATIQSEVARNALELIAERADGLREDAAERVRRLGPDDPEADMYERIAREWDEDHRIIRDALED